MHVYNYKRAIHEVGVVVMEPESTSKENQDPNPFKESLSLSLSAKGKENERFYCVTTKQSTTMSKPIWVQEH